MPAAASAPRYEERLPQPGLRAWVRTCWVQSSGDVPLLRRDLPTGGVELQLVLGGESILAGPLTASSRSALPASSTLVGMRFWPGAAAAAVTAVPGFRAGPASDLVDRRVPLSEVWGTTADSLAATLAEAPDPHSALRMLESHVKQVVGQGVGTDPLVRRAAGQLMPGQSIDVSGVAADLTISSSQLRRRFLTAVGLTPKVLERTLRFQGYLALAQAAAASAAQVSLANLAATAGYADQSHLARECLRLSGLTPRQLLGGGTASGGCGHDHRASFRPFLERAGSSLSAYGSARFVQSTASAAP